MSDTTETTDDVVIDPVTGEIIDQRELAERLLAQAGEQGVSLVGPGGLLGQLTKNVLETALEAEETRASRPRARWHPGGREPAQWAANQDRADRDRPGRDRGPQGPRWHV